MAARLQLKSTPEERLRRLSIVFAVELRIKIVSELNAMRLSATQFVDKFGGGTVSRVFQNFQRLELEDWLSLVGSFGPGGARRGGTEHLYRATEPAFFDAESWALLPYSVRVASSWNFFKQAAARLRSAIETHEQGNMACTRDLTCQEISLDEQGWARVIGEVDVLFASLFAEQTDSQLRAIEGRVALIPMDVYVFAFESPTAAPVRQPELIARRQESLAPFSKRLSVILGDELFRRIVGYLNWHDLSAAQFHREVGGRNARQIRRRFRRLSDIGWIAKVDARRRNGAREHFYRATSPVMDEYDPLAGAQGVLVEADSWAVYERFCAKTIEALVAGTFDARVDRYASWSAIHLDRIGQEKVIGGIEKLAALVRDEERAAARRMRASGEPPTAATLALASLEAPRDLPKLP